MVEPNNPDLNFLYAFSVHNEVNIHYRLHAHRYHELVLVQNGRFRSHVLGNEYIALPGDILLYPARTPHEEWGDENKHVITWTCGFEYNGFPLDEPVLRRDVDGAIQDFLIALTPLHYQDKVSGTMERHKSECRTVLQSLLTEMERLKLRGPQATVEKVRAYIRAHLADTITIDDMAACAGLSRSHFSRLFHASAGRTPWAEVQYLRMEEARRLLTTTTLALHEVAPHVGVANEFHLSRLLKNVLGVRVSDLRPSKGKNSP